MEDLYGSTFQTVPRFACASGDLPDRGCTTDDCIACHLHASDNMLIRAVQILRLRAEDCECFPARESPSPCSMSEANSKFSWRKRTAWSG